MARNLSPIGFHADDTLWHNQRDFQMTQAHVAQLLSEHADHAARGLMVGNSMRSDVLPMIAAGGWGCLFRIAPHGGLND